MEEKLKASFFNELSTSELYEILRVRSAVFVVEQNCIYLDMDGRDQRSLHVFLMRDDRILAYLRIFAEEGSPGTMHIGRVLTTERGKGYGNTILREGIRLCRETLGASRITLEAQCYASGFYEKQGFEICSEPFLDDGIPHVQMQLILTYLCGN